MFDVLEYVLIATKAMCIIAMISMALTAKQKKLKTRIFCALASVIFLTAAYGFLREITGITLLSENLTFTIMIFLYGNLCYEDNLKPRLIFTFAVASLSAVCAHLNSAAFWAYSGHADLLNEGESLIGRLSVLAEEINVQIAVIGIFVILWNRLYRHRKIVKYIYVYLVFPISQFVTLFYINGDTVYRRLFGDAVSVIGVEISYIADIVLCYMLLNQEYKKELENRLYEMKKVQELEQAHFDAVEADREKINKLSLEFDRQLAEIMDCVENGEKAEADALFKRLKTDVSSTKERQYCANAVVNAVLTEKEILARQSSIDVDINLTVKQESTVSPMHLCSVFSNLIDNAINATSVYDGDRNIHVNAGYTGDYFFVNVENSCARPAKRPVRKGHGYGLKILEDIARQYDGQFDYGWQDGTYSARIMLTVC